MAAAARPPTPVLIDLRVFGLGVALGIIGWLTSGIPVGSLRPGSLLVIVGLIVIVIEVWSGVRAGRVAPRPSPA